MEMEKKNLGRRKVKMVKMKNDSNRQVTFSKRRAGLFKKASELCTLCGAEIGIIVFSPGNKVFSFGHPEIGNVIDRYFNKNSSGNSGTLQLIEAHRNANVRELNMQLTELSNQLEIEKKRGEELNQLRRSSSQYNWWEAPIEKLSQQQLLTLKSSLEELKNNVAKQADALIVQIQTTNTQHLFMGSSSTGIFPNNETNIAFDANMMPQNYNLPNMNMMPVGYNPNPEEFHLNQPQCYNHPGPPPVGFGHGFF